MRGKLAIIVLIVFFATPLSAQELTGTLQQIKKSGQIRMGYRVSKPPMSFLDKGAVQCGFCTAGMVMTTKSFLEKNPKPTEREIRQALSGNICRCTGYAKIVEAVEDAAKKMQR